MESYPPVTTVVSSHSSPCLWGSSIGLFLASTWGRCWGGALPEMVLRCLKSVRGGASVIISITLDWSLSMSYSLADYLDDLDFRISLRDAFERGCVFGGTRIA